jgi:hypothetical protein
MPGLYFTVESGAQAHLAARLTRAVEKVRVMSSEARFCSHVKQERFTTPACYRMVISCAHMKEADSKKHQ